MSWISISNLAAVIERARERKRRHSPTKLLTRRWLSEEIKFLLANFKSIHHISLWTYMHLVLHRFHGTQFAYVLLAWMHILICHCLHFMILWNAARCRLLRSRGPFTRQNKWIECHQRIHLMQIICTQDSLSTTDNVNVFMFSIDSIRLKTTRFMLYNFVQPYIIWNNK